MRGVDEATLQSVVVKTADCPADMGINPPAIINTTVTCKLPTLLKMGPADPLIKDLVEQGDWNKVYELIGKPKTIHEVAQALTLHLQSKIANEAARNEPDRQLINVLTDNLAVVKNRYEELKQNAAACPICFEDLIIQPTTTECLSPRLLQPLYLFYNGWSTIHTALSAGPELMSRSWSIQKIDPKKIRKTR